VSDLITNYKLEWLTKLININKMQSEMADFVPGAATWRSRLNNVVWHLTAATTWWIVQNTHVVFEYGLFPHYMQTWHPYNLNDNASHCHQRTKSQPKLTGTEIWTWFLRASQQTDKQTSKQTIQTHWSQYFAHLPR